MLYAFDYNAFIKDLLHDFGREAQGPIPRTVLGHDNSLYIYPTDFARALLQKAGVPSGTKMILWYQSEDYAAAPILVQASLDVGYAILAASSLSFLGLGVLPPTAEWGTMMADARNYLQEAWWMAAFPDLALAVAALAFNLLGDGLRDYLDPELR